MAWYSDPTKVPAPKKKEYGKWKHDYTRREGGQYGGEWLIRRSFEGERPPGFDASKLSFARTLPSSWSPTASQFPWTMRKGITSDAERQGAFRWGIGGTRPTSVTRKAYGTYFDPESGFNKPVQTSMGVGPIRHGGAPKTPTTFGPSLPQPTAFPWSGQPTTERYLNWLNQKNQRYSNWLRAI